MKALSPHCQTDNRLERVLAKYERTDIPHMELTRKC
jgi:hypothetical protein